jgi:ABC-type bacteriocin/lantibiotic exporter with double-glycine peptidase domain
VLVDGVDLSMVDPAWLRRQVGVVLQENLLFNRSVRENIAMADPAMPMSRVVEVAKLAGAHDFILELPEAYDTRIDERGGNLSGGQRQRLAIARALAIDPKILIFDEATSALDAESEEVIRDNLKRMSAGRTVIIIAHRLSAVRQANRIVTLERGRITETGTHEDLLRAGGRYHRSTPNRWACSPWRFPELTTAGPAKDSTHVERTEASPGHPAREPAWSVRSRTCAARPRRLPACRAGDSGKPRTRSAAPFSGC